MNNIYDLILGKDFMNKPVGSKHDGLSEAEYMKKKIEEFKNRKK